jgi:D-arabinose 1-dehydrogenase-like Zn-dependent alcohol dehydrogenase
VPLLPDNASSQLIAHPLLPLSHSFFPILATGASVFALTVSTETLPLSPVALLTGSLRVVGSNVAQVASLRAMLAFVSHHGVRPQVETFPLTRAGAAEAMQRLRGKMRYRGVLLAE